MTVYDFKEQLAKGQKAEAYLDSFFTEWYRIQPATEDEQRKGIDRIFTRRDNGQSCPIEYKTDWTASKTGNAFVETVSVSTSGKRGWAYTSTATHLIYHIPGDMLIYVIDFKILRLNLSLWGRKYPSRTIPNRGYFTEGLLVPLMEFEKIAKEVISI